MLERVEERFDITPTRLIGDTAYGTAPMLGWIVEEKKLQPHIPVWDKSERGDGTFGRSDFTFDAANDRYICPAGKHLKPAWRSKQKNPFRSAITIGWLALISFSDALSFDIAARLFPSLVLAPVRWHGHCVAPAGRYGSIALPVHERSKGVRCLRARPRTPKARVPPCAIFAPTAWPGLAMVLSRATRTGSCGCRGRVEQ